MIKRLIFLILFLIPDDIEVAVGLDPLVNEKAVTGAIQSILLDEE